MKRFLISAERLEKEINHNTKGKGKGVINWFFNSQDEDKIYIYLDVYNVGYLHIATLDSLGPTIRSALLESGEVLGEYEEPEEELPSYPYKELKEMESDY